MKTQKSKPKQKSLLPLTSKRKESGGSLSLGVRKKRRALSIKTPLHLVLRSDFAYGRRSLLRHRPRINRILIKFSKRFNISIYQKAIVSNHIHILVRGKSRTDLQNFFRVVAGHIAQEILREHPIQDWEQRASEGGASTHSKIPTRDKDNKFWQTRIYSRVMSWGRDFINVKNYIIQNTKEALGLVKYKARKQALRNFSLFGAVPGDSTRRAVPADSTRWAASRRGLAV